MSSASKVAAMPYGTNKKRVFDAAHGDDQYYDMSKSSPGLVDIFNAKNGLLTPPTSPERQQRPSKLARSGSKIGEVLRSALRSLTNNSGS